MALTIEPENGTRYQGIVPMHQHSLAANLEDYFRQSEQLATRIWLFSNGKKASGLMLQAMPEGHNEESFEHLCQLAETLTEKEALKLDRDTILHRLFHQDPLRLFPASSVEFFCGCNREKSLASLTLVPKEELHEILDKDGVINVNCEFCQKNYQYDSIDVEQIFANSGHDMQNPTRQ